jgi:hypothetical protein
MAVYELTNDDLVALAETTFSNEGVMERQDLQRLLREKIEVVAPDTLVIAEEFGRWEESKRRIDLLALDKQANLVVIELKRTEDGGHMELQAIRYAAMVSNMTFDKAVTAYESYLKRLNRDEDAQDNILNFLEWGEPKEDEFAQDVRIVLVSAEFSKELTSAVLWLNQRMLDIRCVRLRPYRLDDRLIVDVQQIIPLPEAVDYQISLREKEQKSRSSQWQPKTMDEIWKDLTGNCSDQVASAARDIFNWLTPRVEEVFPTKNGFAALILENGLKNYPFKVTTNGSVEVWFRYMSQKPPFEDEGLRRILLEKLNRIPGVQIGEDRLQGKPKIELDALLSPTSMSMFKETWEWAFERMKENGESEVEAG